MWIALTGFFFCTTIFFLWAMLLFSAGEDKAKAEVFAMVRVLRGWENLRRSTPEKRECARLMFVALDTHRQKVNEGS
jgi:hypothetical protein